jgi:hypothetical protein
LIVQQKLTQKITPTGVQTERSPKSKISRALDTSPKQFNGMVYGSPATGKSTIIAMLAALGYKVFVLITDLGGAAGMTGARGYAKKTGTTEAFDKNVTWWVAKDIDEFDKFLADPNSVIDNFWQEANPDWIVFDGFSTWQATQVIPDIEVMDNANDEETYSFATYKGWGKVKNRTIRALQDLLLLTKPDGTPIHKLITAGLRVGSKKLAGADSSELVDVPEPDISGAAKRILGYAFDMVFQTVRDKDGKYYYSFGGAYGKRRIETVDVMNADFSKVWELQQKLWET